MASQWSVVSGQWSVGGGLPVAHHQCVHAVVEVSSKVDWYSCTRYATTRCGDVQDGEHANVDVPGMACTPWSICLGVNGVHAHCSRPTELLSGHLPRPPPRPHPDPTAASRSGKHSACRLTVASINCKQEAKPDKICTT